MSELYTKFDNVFFEKTRLSMVTIIFQKEKVSFNYLKKRIGGTDGSIYTHLEKLIKAGYVEKHKEIVGTGVQTIYQLTKNGKRHFKEYIDFLESVLASTTNNLGEWGRSDDI